MGASADKNRHAGIGKSQFGRNPRYEKVIWDWSRVVCHCDDNFGGTPLGVNAC